MEYVSSPPNTHNVTHGAIQADLSDQVVQDQEIVERLVRMRHRHGFIAAVHAIFAGENFSLLWI